MIINSFFKPTRLFKEYIILENIEKNKNITQRILAFKTRTAVSLINLFLNDLEEDKLIIRNKFSTKTIEYNITRKGKARKKLLNFWYLKSTQEIYSSAKKNIIVFINQICNKGFKKILLYGAGEVASLFLNVLKEEVDLKFSISAIIDDDISLINKHLIDIPIISIEDIPKYDYDVILISAYKDQIKIYKNLQNKNIKKNKIINFFDTY